MLKQSLVVVAVLAAAGLAVAPESALANVTPGYGKMLVQLADDATSPAPAVTPPASGDDSSNADSDNDDDSMMDQGDSDGDNDDDSGAGSTNTNNSSDGSY